MTACLLILLAVVVVGVAEIVYCNMAQQDAPNRGFEPGEM